MTYNKPEVVKLENAVKAIQQGDEKYSIFADNNQVPTPAAYQADE